jgi:peptidoglycan/xylan/chitin deacetylase (PgdA/CDA1 family)
MTVLRALFFCLVCVCIAGCAQAQPRTESVDAGPRYIAVTFDDGPDREVTPQLLDLFKRHDARATFFPMASKIAGNESILARMVAERHVIGNHTLSHRRLSSLSDFEIASELDGASEILRPITGQAPTVFRPPYASLGDRVAQAAGERGMAIILWSMYPEQLAFLSNSASIGSRIVADARDGDIIFMHDTSPRTVQVMEIALRGLTAKGFTFVTVPELLTRAGGMRPGVTYERASESNERAK